MAMACMEAALRLRKRTPRGWCVILWHDTTWVVKHVQVLPDGNCKLRASAGGVTQRACGGDGFRRGITANNWLRLDASTPASPTIPHAQSPPPYKRLTKIAAVGSEDALVWAHVATNL